MQHFDNRCESLHTFGITRSVSFARDGVDWSCRTRIRIRRYKNPYSVPPRGEDVLQAAQLASFASTKAEVLHVQYAEHLRLEVCRLETRLSWPRSRVFQDVISTGTSVLTGFSWRKCGEVFNETVDLYA
jgi:hypothetical protein